MWHDRAKHCPLCGAGLTEATVEARQRRRCSSCEFVLYQNPASAAAGVVLNPEGRVLLVQRAIEPFKGFWALPAGYQEIDEEPEAALMREVREEAGIDVRVLGLLDLIFIRDDPRKPANVAIYLCRAVSGTGGVSLTPGFDVSDVGWFDLDRLPERIGFDNRQLILGRLGDRERHPTSAWTSLQELLGARRGGGRRS